MGWFLGNLINLLIYIKKEEKELERGGKVHKNDGVAGQCLFDF